MIGILTPTELEDDSSQLSFANEIKNTKAFKCLK